MHSSSLGLAERRQDLPAQLPVRCAGSCLENLVIRGFTGRACVPGSPGAVASQTIDVQDSKRV